MQQPKLCGSLQEGVTLPCLQLDGAVRQLSLDRHCFQVVERFRTFDVKEECPQSVKLDVASRIIMHASDDRFVGCEGACHNIRCLLFPFDPSFVLERKVLWYVMVQQCLCQQSSICVIAFSVI